MAINVKAVDYIRGSGKKNSELALIKKKINSIFGIGNKVLKKPYFFST